MLFLNFSKKSFSPLRLLSSMSVFLLILSGFFDKKKHKILFFNGLLKFIKSFIPGINDLFNFKYFFIKINLQNAVKIG